MRADVCVRIHACMCAHDVCLFGARPSGHPLTVNNEHGTYDRCVGDGGLYRVSRTTWDFLESRGCVRMRVSEKGKVEEKRRRRGEEKQSHPRSRVNSLFFFLSLPFGRLKFKDDFGEVGLWQIHITKHV